MKKIEFFIKGMHCASCVYVNEEALKKINGVKNAVVNLATGKAMIEVEKEVDLTLLKKAVEALGYQAVFEEEKNLDEKINKEREEEIKKLKTKVIIGLVVSFFIVWGSFPFLMQSAPSIFKNFFFQFIVASFVQFYCGFEFYRSAIIALKKRKANMDTLVSIGTTAAYFYSTLVLFFPDFFSYQVDEVMPYFDVSAVVVSFVLLGRYLEAKAKLQTSEAIKKLIGLQPKEATLIVR